MNSSRAIVFLSGLVAVPWFLVGAMAMDQVGSEPRRATVDINAYPWASIGKIGIAGVALRTSCTGSVIGSKQFLTAAHCLYSKTTGRFVSAGEIHFLLAYNKGEYRAHRVGAGYVTSPKFDPAKIETAGDDWAVVSIDEPFPPDTKPLRLAVERPKPGTPVKTGGYPTEKAHLITADKHCHVTAVSNDGKLVTNDCIIHHGDSGGPLLGEDDAEGLIWGVNSLGYSQLVELKDQSKAGGAAAAAWAIQQSLASQGADGGDGSQRAPSRTKP
jgi:protease YdgD